jgi:hypothetical protein
MTEEPPFLYHPKFRRIDLAPPELSNLLNLRQYAEKYRYSISGVRYLIATRRVNAYKMQSMWWLEDAEPF